MNRMCSLFAIMLLFLNAGLVASDGSVANIVGKKCIIAVRSHNGEFSTLRKWTATAEYLSKKVSDCRFEIKTVAGFEEMRQIVRKNKAMFILTNSAAYVDLKSRYGVIRLVTLINKTNNHGVTKFGGVLFTLRNRSEITTISDLKGKSFMAVHKEAFGGWWMQLREFHLHGIDPAHDFSHMKFGNTHAKVVLAVKNNLVDAGAVRTNILENMAAKGIIKLGDFHIIHQQQDSSFPFLHSTRLYPEWPFAKAKTTSPTLAKKVILALLSISPKNRAALHGKYMGWTAPIDYQPVYKLMKELNVGPFENRSILTWNILFSEYWQWLLMILTLMSGLAYMLLRMRIMNSSIMQTQRELRCSNNRLENLATIDGLTGIPNRRKLDEYLNHEWRRAYRNNSVISILMCDIDYFKDFNDQYGHLEGDVCLQKIANEMYSMFRRPTDMVARYGGEEFIIVLPDTINSDAAQMAKMVCKKVVDLKIVNRKSTEHSYVTVSVGVATQKVVYNYNYTKLIKSADSALYLAKKRGRNQVAIEA